MLTAITPQAFARAIRRTVDEKAGCEIGHRAAAERACEAHGLDPEWATPIRICLAAGSRREARRWAEEMRKEG